MMPSKQAGGGQYEHKKQGHTLCHSGGTIYAINIPLSKLLLGQVSPTMIASFLYLGAGVGLFLYGLATKEKEKALP